MGDVEARGLVKALADATWRGEVELVGCPERAVSGIDQRQGLATWLLASPWLAAHVAAARADALEQAADAWSHGQWADAPRRADRVQERMANAQHVGDWLRARAAALRTQTAGEGS